MVNVLKPPGMTSSDVVSDLRHIFDMKRVGHTGTLDPGAAGVLPVCLGRATRLFDLLVDKQKEYIAELCVGAETDTQDAYGKAIAVCDKTVSADEVTTALARFMGEQQQIAPMYSAVRIDGRQMYKIARAGESIDETKLKVRSITIYTLELIRQSAPNRFMIRIVCSKGTYVRTLCRDIGNSMGVNAYMSFLLRVRSGNFEIGDAFTLEELRAMRETDTLQTALTSVETVLGNMNEARVTLDEENSKRLINGAPVKVAGITADGVQLRIYCNGEFIGVGKCESDGLRINMFLRGDTNG
ncbi:MAG: tRNA pseudouridine(55) synthase TruB [Clostridia bacterium]